jgi:nucleoside-diphosphate-sugar epimerase
LSIFHPLLSHHIGEVASERRLVMQTERSIAVLGAKGRLGREAAKAFRAAGWRVVAVTRKGDCDLAGVENRAADASDAAAAARAVAGCAFIFHGLNPIYTQWRGSVVPMLTNTIAAARKSGATILFPGNVYNFGQAIPAHPVEDTPQSGDHEKAAIRIEAERLLEDAAGDGVRSIVLRAGDFFGGEGRGSWFDQALASRLKQGKAVWLGRGGIVHAWAYLPDLARAFVAVAERSQSLPAFARFHFEGHNVTLEEMHAAMEKAAGRPLKRAAFPWWILSLASPFSAMMRALTQMRYLWDRPHRLTGEKLAAITGLLPRTTLDDAVAAAMAEMGEEPIAQRRSSAIAD